ncbi:MAG: hypothetical protein J5J06_08070 [Phycisphaerae bacterium]|nr:hypothetical protein [Phycisphaerae bacterium]
MAGQHFEFTREGANELIEKVGITVAPTIELSLERPHFLEFFNCVSKEYPNLFESMRLNPSEFSIFKTFEFPGKGSAEAPTFVLGSRGPLLILPRRLSAIDAETSLQATDNDVMKILKSFRTCFRQLRIYRVGKIREYIFDCGETDSNDMVRRAFLGIDSPTSEILLRINVGDAVNNKIFTVQPVRRHTADATGRIEPTGFGIKVSVDFNNADVSRELNDDEIVALLHRSNDFHDSAAIDFLNSRRLGQ